MPALANTQVYRCGNAYTNLPSVRHTGCTLLQGGEVSVVHSHSEQVRPQRMAARMPFRAKPVSRVVKVAKRQSPSRAALQAELAKAQSRLNTLLSQYNNGEPERLASERNNHQQYLQRVFALRADIQRTESDIAGLQRGLQHAGS